MDLIPVESSMISAVAYEADKRLLYVVFNGGKTYTYHDVPPDVYEGLLNADSKGSYMRAYIIDMYPYSKGMKR
ncbi:MAG: KTSC domain-containing protein [Anaerolineae bacterium]|jgi:hypothetical protein|nr:KTSC domain-containing protein [Anaerolineae bacterium]